MTLGEKRKLVYLLFLILVTFSQTVSAKMYRWIDTEGKVFYSDQVPPEQVKHKREAINKHGSIIEITEAEKSIEQWELEKRLERLRKEQEKIIAKQRTHDKVLLTTYRTLDDMQMALQGKIAAFDAQRHIFEGNLKQLDKLLQVQQSEAAQHELRGQKAPQQIVDEIKTTEKKIKLKIAEIKMHDEKKKRAKAAFYADIERYKFLRQTDFDSVAASDETAVTKAANELGLFFCESEVQCRHAWDAARLFVKKYSTVQINVDTDKLIMSGDPKSESDISLSVSKMSKINSKPQIFLDIRCRKSSLGKELCSSLPVRQIRKSFNPFIQSILAAQ
jgi:uncharacterized protein DUF4124